MVFFNKNNDSDLASFWDHLEALRWTIFRVLIFLVIFVSVIFGFKDFIFNEIIFKPISSEFVFYQFLCQVGEWIHMPSLCPESFNLQLININLSGQFIAHISATFSISLILLVPYLLFEVWRFIAPALYPNEKHSVGTIFFMSSFLFYVGAAVSYFMIFPLTLRFLGTYEISKFVPNQISIQSYLSTLYILVFSLGLMFEMPILAYFLSKLGVISRDTLKNIRGYALVVIMILSAVITPTTDPFTMLVVVFPLYLLYEVSILVTKKKKIEEKDDEEVD